MTGTMRTIGFLALLVAANLARGDSQSDELANWLNERGQVYWGQWPQSCDEHAFARRVYLDIVGRVPSVSEIRDFQELGEQRRVELVDQLVHSLGDRKETYDLLRADQLAKMWRRVLLPPGAGNIQTAGTLETWLKGEFSQKKSMPEIARQIALAKEGSSNYFQIVGSLPENYAAHLSRAFLGVRIECAQCHDHPFAKWKQSDFWGVAAYYSDLATQNPGAVGSIEHDGVKYDAKTLWSNSDRVRSRAEFARWLVDPKNPHFAATIVNRTWQQMTGRGLYPDIDNLDTALPDDRKFLDEVAEKFVLSNYDLNYLMAGIMKSRWYQAVSTGNEPVGNQFARGLKVSTPEQVFDSLEQSLLLSRTRIDRASPRWTGERGQFVGRLEETAVADPREYQSGIPQSLMLMNGKLTNNAIGYDESRLLRAIIDAPFMNKDSRLETLYLAVLTRPPTEEEKNTLNEYVSSKQGDELNHAYGEILWALINSPEFVLCR